MAGRFVKNGVTRMLMEYLTAALAGGLFTVFGWLVLFLPPRLQRR
jgi:hypothetical protein